MTVNLLLILRFKNEDNLNRHQVVGIGIVFGWKNELGLGVHAELCCVLRDRLGTRNRHVERPYLEYMGYSLSPINFLFHHTVLIGADGR
jgi:hypothetical protein